MIPPPRATLAEFAAVSDVAAAIPAKLQKQKILADYLKTLDDEDLRLAVRYSAGRAFPSVDERVLGASGAIVSDVILSIHPIPGAEFHALVVRSGEIGEALSALIVERTADTTSDTSRLAGAHARRSPARDAVLESDSGSRTDESSPPLSLHDIALAFDEIASTGNQARKRDILQTIFRRAARPREGAYLAKIIFGDLRTGVKEGILQAAVALAFGKMLPEIQRTQLLVGDLPEVALLARRDGLASARFELFHPLQFMLATPQETTGIAVSTMDGRTFFAEDKLDGIRAQIHKSGEGNAARVQIYTRTMDRTEGSFPDVVTPVQQLPGEFLLDGEIVPYRDGVVLPFANIQKRLGRKVLSAKILRDHPAAFIAFDLLFHDGDLLMDQPLRERRERLDRLARSSTLLTTAVAEVRSAEQIDQAFCTARDCRNEGLVLKDPESVYAPGRRGQAWLKLKTHLPTIDCVVTAAEYGHGKRRNSLSDYTFAVWDREPGVDGAALVNVGKAFSGVTDEEIKTLTELFLGIATGQRGRVYLVRPQVVVEIACDQIQKSARHASGFALRFPRIKRIRWDKRPADADTRARVAELFQSTDNMAHASIEDAPKPAEPTLFDGV